MADASFKLMNKNMFLLRILLIVCCGFIFAMPPATAQVTLADKAAMANPPMRMADLSLESKLMGRSMPYRVLLPPDYEQNIPRRYPVIYLLHGLTGHFDDWEKRTKLSSYAREAGFIIVMPEGNDGWYTDSGVVAEDKYESYIIKELVPEVDQKFRTMPERSRRAIAGLSMGGYGSLKFGIKYPEKFVVVGSFSGALMAPSLSVKSLKGGWKALEDSIANVFGADDAPVRKANDIFGLVRLLDAQQIKALPFLYLDCGTEDGLIQANRDFAALLSEKKIPHEYRQRPGKHDWIYWDSQVQEFLRLATKLMPE